MITDVHSKIKTVIEDLNKKGILQRGSGYCVAMADLISRLLVSKDINARTTECQVTIMGKNPPMLHLLGYDNVDVTDNQVTTHVVVIIEDGDKQWLLDGSVYHILGGFPSYILTEITKTEYYPIIVQTEIGHQQWTYTVKEQPKLPMIQQQTLLRRMSTDLKVRKDIDWLKIAVTVAVILTSLNAVQGAYDHYQSPRQMQEMYQKLERIEQKINSGSTGDKST
jgi:hypothetical protein